MTRRGRRRSSRIRRKYVSENKQLTIGQNRDGIMYLATPCARFCATPIIHRSWPADRVTNVGGAPLWLLTKPRQEMTWHRMTQFACVLTDRASHRASTQTWRHRWRQRNVYYHARVSSFAFRQRPFFTESPLLSICSSAQDAPVVLSPSLVYADSRRDIRVVVSQYGDYDDVNANHLIPAYFLIHLLQYIT